MPSTSAEYFSRISCHTNSHVPSQANCVASTSEFRVLDLELLMEGI